MVKGFEPNGRLMNNVKVRGSFRIQRMIFEVYVHKK